MPDGIPIIMRGFAKNSLRSNALRIKCFNIVSVISKSAIPHPEVDEQQQRYQAYDQSFAWRHPQPQVLILLNPMQLQKALE